MRRNTKIWGWHYFSLSDFKLWSTSFDFTEKLSGFLIGYSSILGDSHRFSDTPNEKCFVKSPNSQPTQKVWLSLESENTGCPRYFNFFHFLIERVDFPFFHTVFFYQFMHVENYWYYWGHIWSYCCLSRLILPLGSLIGNWALKDPYLLVLRPIGTPL